MALIRNIRGKSRIRIACTVELMSGVFMQGYTRVISVDCVSIDTHGFSLSGKQPPCPGESGVLALRYWRAGVLHELRVHCNLMQVVSCGLELTVTYSELTVPDQKTLQEILESGSGRLS